MKRNELSIAAAKGFFFSPVASGPERSAPVKFCQKQNTCSSYRLFTPRFPAPQPGRREGPWPRRLRQEQGERAGRRRCPGTHERGGSEAAPVLVLGADGAPLLASQQPTRRRSLYRAAALSGVFECLVHVQSRSLPQKSFPKQVPRNPEALLAVIRCFWRKGHCGQGGLGKLFKQRQSLSSPGITRACCRPRIYRNGEKFFLWNVS